MGELLALLSMMLFAINMIVTKMATSRLSLTIGFFISASVNIIFSTCLFAVDYMLKGEVQPFHLTAFMLFLVSGVFTTFLGRWFFFETIERLGPAKASTFQTSNPLFTVLISWAVLGESLSVSKWFAVIIVLSGLFLVNYVKPRQELTEVTNAADSEIAVSRQKGWNVPRTLFHPYIVLALLSSLSYAIGNILRGTAIQQWNEPILGALIGAVVGLLLHMTFSMKISTIANQIRKADRRGFWLYVISGTITITAQILYIASMKLLPVSIATVINMSTPILVLPISYFILKNQEGITWRTLLGVLMVLAGINVIILM
ncbi:DMT family transporter [Paenibacillus alginolyticus]|uniref:DMT family transporter n=1 Tax=Paenibacillus alginolyticus TaxID=59839 RepID=UPI000410E982|nr:DMT family transporter [Paenibacillus alginolyticus]MCY9666772.1 DMT family transporter [Paenibacillus alginolyticus]